MKFSYNNYKFIDFLEDQSFVSYVKGTDPDQVKIWETWLEGNPPNKDLAEEAYRFVSIMKHGEHPSLRYSKEEEFDKVINRIRHHEIIHSGSGADSLKIWLRVAAVIIVLLSVGTGYLLLKSSLFSKNNLALNEITVPKGSRTKIILEDGSTVWLNAESTLKYPASFSGPERNVELTGEAYFNVTRSTTRPFVVKTADVRINVMGTSFNVKAYPNEDIIETVLESGLVNVEKIRANGKGGNTIVLRPRQRLVLYKSTLNAEITEVDTGIDRAEEKTAPPDPGIHKEPGLYSNYDTELSTSWKDGKLIFKGESLDILTARLEKWYNVNIRIADPALNRKSYTGTFEKETIEQAMEALCLASDIKYTIEKNNIVIYK